ncbi:hypothetical protein DBR44_03900 [Aquitalea sp. FJL05]|uniref:O-antigen ligase family protein n=1 Tax=Aquitalea sp. FJL05 TaxID=2153366 RepID=UPI000F5A09EF|nr:O-antigen ligase family protein [Aquitalea sp. FJL05]RQO76830.1 hypothetical protein DBR44_03900 [Aquitalea sp. FJL05]
MKSLISTPKMIGNMQKSPQENLIKYYGLPFSLWLTTVYGCPQWGFIFVAIISLLSPTSTPKESNFYRKELFWLAAITVACSLNFTIGLYFGSPQSINRSPYFIGLIVTFLIASKLEKKQLIAISWLTAIECLILFIEFILKINTVFTYHPEYKSGIDYSYIYWGRPFGLSDGSNSFAIKLVIALGIVNYLMETQWKKHLLQGIIISALIINFSRSAFIAIIFHYIFLYNFHHNNKNLYRKLSAAIIAIISTIIITNPFNIASKIAFHLNHGKKTIDYSYRDEIWKSCINFITNNPILGNNSSRFYIWNADYKQWEHAHNSFLHLITSNGILITGLISFWILKHVSKHNFGLLLPLIIFSMGQYGIFWSISIQDVLFINLLIFSKNYRTQK